MRGDRSSPMKLFKASSTFFDFAWPFTIRIRGVKSLRKNKSVAREKYYTRIERNLSDMQRLIIKATTNWIRAFKREF